VSQDIPDSLSALHKIFKDGGEVSFVIPKSRAKRMRVQFRRIYNAEAYFAHRFFFFGSVRANIYALYVALHGAFLSYGCKDMGRALLVYETSWKLLAPIEGEDLPDGKAKITYRGKIKSMGSDSIDLAGSWY